MQSSISITACKSDLRVASLSIHFHASPLKDVPQEVHLAFRSKIQGLWELEMQETGKICTSLSQLQIRAETLWLQGTCSDLLLHYTDLSANTSSGWEKTEVWFSGGKKQRILKGEVGVSMVQAAGEPASLWEFRSRVEDDVGFTQGDVIPPRLLLRIFIKILIFPALQ